MILVYITQAALYSSAQDGVAAEGGVRWLLGAPKEEAEAGASELGAPPLHPRANPGRIRRAVHPVRLSGGPGLRPGSCPQRGRPSPLPGGLLSVPLRWSP